MKILPPVTFQPPSAAFAPWKEEQESGRMFVGPLWLAAVGEEITAGAVADERGGNRKRRVRGRFLFEQTHTHTSRFEED